MNAERAAAASSEAEALFHAAAELPAEQRARLLAERCAHDPELRSLVERLLSWHDRAGSFLEPRASAAEWPDEAADVLAPGERIGQYTVRGVLGVGGMGVVYLAEGERPRRRVALKVIRPGLVSRAALRRFEHEAQVLARLQHPGIASVYEVGASPGPGGPRPYLAMELVEGVPLVDHARGLAVRARLELFARVCDAVQHAHQKGVIHRDLKPGNILVQEADGVAQPRVLDFGIARATDPGPEAMTRVTAAGQLIGTLAYMSPEQVSGDPDALDTRSDVHALGVILYELLAGRLPHDVAGLPLPEAARRIKEEEPPALGTIDRSLRGDVETIARKALEKDRERRYASAADLGADVRRYLRDEPIVARPPTTTYQLRKFARRNKPVVAAAGAALAILIIGLVATSWQAWVAMGRLERATAAERLADQRLQRVRQEAAIAADTVRMLQDLLAAADPAVARGRDVTVAEVLDRAASRLAASPEVPPVVRGAMRHTIGVTYHALGRFHDAEEHLRAALSLRRDALGADHPDTVRSLTAYALAVRFASTSEALDPATEALAAAQRVLGPHDPTTIRALDNLANVRWIVGDHEATIRLRRQAYELAREGLGEDDPLTLSLAISHAVNLAATDQREDAAALTERTLEMQKRVLGPNHPDVFEAQNTLAGMYFGLGRAGEAEHLYRAALDGRRAVQGEDHLSTRYQVHILASFYQMRGEPDKAEPLFRTLVEREAITPEAVAAVLGYHRQLARCIEAQGRREEALDVRRRALSMAQARLAPGHPQVGRCLGELAEALHAMGRSTEALPLFEEAVSTSGPPSPVVRLAFGRCLLDLGQHARAEAELLASLEGFAAPDVDHATHRYARGAGTRDAHAALARLYERTGRSEEAAAHLAAAEAAAAE